MKSMFWVRDAPVAYVTPHQECPSCRLPVRLDGARFAAHPPTTKAGDNRRCPGSETTPETR